MISNKGVVCTSISTKPSQRPENTRGREKGKRNSNAEYVSLPQATGTKKQVQTPYTPSDDKTITALTRFRSIQIKSSNPKLEVMTTGVSHM